MNYIGDLSKYDYEILKNLSLECNNILGAYMKNENQTGKTNRE
jgi:hypothetical protein